MPLRYQYERFHPRLWGLYGLKDALNAQCDPAWVDNDYVGIDVGAMVLMIENYRSGLVWDTFMENQEIAAAMAAVGSVEDEAREPSYLFYREAEAYASTTGGGIAREDDAAAWSGKTLQIGTEAGNSAVYTVPVDSGGSMLFGVRYSDDVAGEVIEVRLDGTRRGSFTTDSFGDWDVFGWDEETVGLGLVSSGTHTVTLRVAADGSELWGVNLDVFKIWAAPRIYLPVVRRSG